VTLEAKNTDKKWKFQMVFQYHVMFVDIIFSSILMIWLYAIVRYGTIFRTINPKYEMPFKIERRD